MRLGPKRHYTPGQTEVKHLIRPSNVVKLTSNTRENGRCDSLSPAQPCPCPPAPCPLASTPCYDLCCMGLLRRFPALAGWLEDLAKWSRPGMYVKRWLVLLVLGLTFLALGIAFFLVQVYRTQPFPEWVAYATLQPIERPWRGALFLLAGGGVIAVAIVQLNRSIMAAVQPAYASGRLVDIVYNYRLPQRRPQVVALAGHRGFVALQHHREVYAQRLVCVASVAEGPFTAESGGAGDRIVPACEEPLELCAELEHGTILRGAEAVRHRRSGIPIKRVFLIREGADPQVTLSEENGFLHFLDVPAHPDSINAVRDADTIILGPGSFYLSVLPNLLIREFRDALQASKARKVLIANLMTEPGQTDDFDVSDFVRTVHAYSGVRLDYVLVNSASSDRLIQERYSAALAAPVLPEPDGAMHGLLVSAGRRLRKLSTVDGAIVLAADLATRMVERVPVPAGTGDGGAATQSIIVFRHDPEKLAYALGALLGVAGAE